MIIRKCLQFFKRLSIPGALLSFAILASCTQPAPEKLDIIGEEFPEAQEEIRAAVASIVRDAETANLDGLRDSHLVSDKFTKFGPRGFERQDVEQTNSSELAFFGKASNYREEVRDLKVDVFGDVGIATYYRSVTYEQDGEQGSGSLRQTLVFVKTPDGWKIVHEHGNRAPE